MKKSTIMIVIIVFLLLIIGFMVYFESFNINNKLTMDDVNFTLPDGFHIGNPNNAGDINLTDGNISIFIKNYDDADIVRYVNSYSNLSEKNNYTIISSNFTIDNIVVYKSVNNDTGSEYFWFVKNNKVFNIYVWGNYTNVDTKIFDLIKSTDYTT